MSDDRLNELAPCPFCGGEAEIVDAEEAGPDARVVCCKGCSASSKVIFALKDDVTDLLVEAWNRRAHLPSNEISSATFDTIETLSKKFPDLGGYYARRTGGADLEHFVQFLAPFAIRSALEPSPAQPWRDQVKAAKIISRLREIVQGGMDGAPGYQTDKEIYGAMHAQVFQLLGCDPLPGAALSPSTNTPDK
jgi:Lar family restriction alleviation protein